MPVQGRLAAADREQLPASVRVRVRVQVRVQVRLQVAGSAQVRRRQRCSVGFHRSD